MKKLTAVAVALLAATSAAQAAEVYKNERMALDMYGRIYAGQFMGTKKGAGTSATQDYSEKVGANQFIRFGVKADSAITGTMKAIAQYEIQSYIGNSEKINNVSCSSSTSEAADGKHTTTTSCKDDALRTRLAFAGVKSDNWGQVTFGRQKGAIAQVSDWTDVSLSDGYGYQALGVGTDTFGTVRSSDLLKYSAKFGDLKSGKSNNGAQVDVSYKFDGNKVEETSSASADQAYGLSASYTLIDSLSFGAGYNVGTRDKTNEEDAKLWLLGVKFDNKSWYAALNYADGSDWLATGTDHTGIEAALGYTFANGFGLLAMYNKQEAEKSGKKYDTVDYYTLGTQYQFNKSLRAILEYRLQNLDAEDYTAAGGKAPFATKDDYQLAVRYDF
ncbi:MAG: porin [Aeromonadaceae bacterium]